MLLLIMATISTYQKFHHVHISAWTHAKKSVTDITAVRQLLTQMIYLLNTKIPNVTIPKFEIKSPQLLSGG